MNNESLNKFMVTVADLTVAHLALFAMLITAGAYFIVYDDGSTLETNIMNVQSALNSENQKKIETQKIIKKEEQMRADVQVFAQRFEEIKSKIPIELTESELRSIIDKVVLESQLRTIRSERTSETGQRGRNQVSSSSDEAVKLIDTITLKYTLQGSYSQISAFVQSLTNQEKLVKFSDFDLSRVRGFGEYKGEGDDNIDELNFSVDIVGYKQSLEAVNSTSPAEGVRR